MKNILFVCTGNSARSIIAESIINNEYSNKFKAYSAGSNPTGKINEDVKRFLEKNKNYDLFEYRSKNFENFLSNNIKIDYVVTVCNNANNEVCPIWPDKNQIIHWDIEDPVSKLLNSNENEKNILINNTFNQINKNIINWIANEK
tara:strand:- start:3 stop:437 length:435 start_codon:yes stop_codon:yes gene_type:complete